MKQFLRDLFSAPFQLVLVISFSFIAALSIAAGAWVITNTISDYLSDAMNERIARDIQLADTFYNLMLSELEGVTERLSKDPLVKRTVIDALQGKGYSYDVLDQQIMNNHSETALGGNHLIAVLDKDGIMLAGHRITYDGEEFKLEPGGNWAGLGIVQNALQYGGYVRGTEIIPASLLTQVDLDGQASITIYETPKAAPELFDQREGTAGLTLTSVAPIKSDSGAIIGAILAFHLLNNDFTLVDRIKDVASIDTATIFFGDLRISTNVMTSENARAIGTRLSQNVSDVVLFRGEEYVGPAFVVDQEYITWYEPLKDHSGNVIGILYVGAKQASFQRLVNTFNERIILVAIGMVLLTIVLTTPVSGFITRPLHQLRVLADANRQVAEGDMSVRVLVRATGEVGLLENSFNTMLDTLQATQNQLVQSENLASLGQLAAGVAHELNNPLGTILLYSDILLKDLGPDSLYREDLEIIVNETKRCKSIVSSLLEFARQNQVTPQQLNLNVFIEDLLGVVKKHYEELSIEFYSDLDSGLPNIQADPLQIQQVLVNLIDNAVDAMPDGGRLTVRTCRGPVGMITLEVQDTGIGIPPDNLSKLYTPFFTTKPLGKGTGLGLAIIYGIVKLHRGQINVHSVLNQGTTFTIQLPIKLQVTGITNQPKTGLVGIDDIQE